MRRHARGFSLIEVLAALSLVGLSVLGLLALAQQQSAAVAIARRAEEEARAASSLLWRLSLLPVDSLFAHLGPSKSGELIYRVRPSGADYYEVEVTSAETGARLMTTGFFRPLILEAAERRQP